MLGSCRPSKLTLLLLVGVLAIVAVTLVAATRCLGLAERPPAGHVRIGTTGASVQLDPALAYITTAWEIEYMTCAKLLNYPDTPWDEHEATRLTARDRSGDADHLRRPPDVHLPDPQRLRLLAARDRRRHRGEHEVHDRAGAEPTLDVSPAISSSRTSRAPTEYHNGQAQRDHAASRPRATPWRSTLIHPQGEFLSFLAMPFFCAVPTTLPPTEQLAPIPSAGPYYISEQPHQRPHHDQP